MAPWRGYGQPHVDSAACLLRYIRTHTSNITFEWLALLGLDREVASSHLGTEAEVFKRVSIYFLSLSKQS